MLPTPIKKTLYFLDRLEDKTRAFLSHNPLLYALAGGVGIVLFWRGVWHVADDIGISSLVSLVTGVLVLLVTGVFVSSFIGNRLILSGLRGEKKLAEKTEEDILTEETQIQKLQDTLDRVEKEITELESEIKK